MTTTVKLNKSERAMLEKAARKPGGGLYAQVWWSTGERSYRSHGARDANAIRSLCEKGLAEGFLVERNSGPTVGGLSTIHSLEYGAKITDAGRQALKS